MTNKLFTACLLLISLTFTACKENKGKASKQETDKEVKGKDNSATANKNPEGQAPHNDFTDQSINDQLAEQLKNYIETEYLSKDDLRAIAEDERKFQLYQIDLNNDGKKEVFVNFITPYFCGTGGCTLLLLTDQLKPITEFTVTRTPLYAEKKTKNRWRVLLTRSEGNLKELIYQDGSYPSNPSMIEKNTTDALGEDAEILFDDDQNNTKTYHF